MLKLASNRSKVCVPDCEMMESILQAPYKIRIEELQGRAIRPMTRDRDVASIGTES